MLVNFNNSLPDEEQKRGIVKDVTSKYQGSSNAGKVIISFNDNKENAATIEAVELSNASDQYQFLSDECMRKILVSHRVTCPLLLGISTTTGFGSNADELKTASILFENQVIRPFRQLLIEGFNKILEFNGINVDLMFESINPWDEEIGDQEEEKDEVVAVEETEETEDLSHQGCTHLGGLEFDDKEMYDAIAKKGEDEDLNTWEIVHEMEVNYEAEDALDEMLNLASTGVARPRQESDQDGEGVNGEEYRVRYQYSPFILF